MKQPFTSLTELDQSGFMIGGLDTGATKTIFKVRVQELLTGSSVRCLQSSGDLNKKLADSRWEGVATFEDVLAKAEGDPGWASISPTQSLYLTLQRHGAKCDMTGTVPTLSWPLSPLCTFRNGSNSLLWPLGVCLEEKISLRSSSQLQVLVLLECFSFILN